MTQSDGWCCYIGICMYSIMDWLWLNRQRCQLLFAIMTKSEGNGILVEQTLGGVGISFPLTLCDNDYDDLIVTKMIDNDRFG